MLIAVRAGQRFVARARRGKRTIRITRVLRGAGVPHACALEQLPSGRERDATGKPVSRRRPTVSILIALDHRDRAWRMPCWYQEVR